MFVVVFTILAANIEALPPLDELDWPHMDDSGKYMLAKKEDGRWKNYWHKTR